jgi:SAM-dependent methyltransferase
MTAPMEVVPLIVQMVHPTSILDIGCGTGTWLKAFEEMGITDYLGIDGDYVDKSMLKISESKFQARNLHNSFSLGRKFDLVLCLEVAEHLEEKYADALIETITKHGDIILFSAAIPGQGGQNHLNEQWPQYWIEKFSDYGFFFHDVIRPLIWNNNRVDYWYKQNTFLISKECSENKIERYIHPDLFKQRLEELENVNRSIRNGELSARESLDILLKSVFRAIKK